VRQTAIIVSSEFPHPTQQVQILKKGSKWPLLYVAGWAAQPSEDISLRFSKTEKPPEDITWCLFLINFKELTYSVHRNPGMQTYRKVIFFWAVLILAAIHFSFPTFNFEKHHQFKVKDLWKKTQKTCATLLKRAFILA
jgi:hypothetical protein